MVPRHLEIVDFAAGSAVLAINDLNTLGRLLQKTYNPDPKSFFSSGFITSIISNVHKLEISLRLQLQLCEALERTATNSRNNLLSSCLSDSANISPEETWALLGSMLSRLQNLRSLEIWFDHDSLESWTVVNERGILSPIERLAEENDLETSVILPKLHPKLETPDRHYCEGSSAPAFEIRRVLRQRYHAEGHGKGVTYRADFPILPDDSDYEDEDDDDPPAELERWERSLWEKGVNVKKLREIHHVMHIFRYI